MSDIKIIEWITIVAIVVGPIIAVIITRIVDDRRHARQRRWEIFRDLMKHRLTALSPEFVGALNVVEVVFHDDKIVIESWRKLQVNYGLGGQNPTEEELRPIFEERKKLTAKMLDTMARNLGIKIEQLDIFSGGYAPRGWFDEDAKTREMREELLKKLREGFPVIVKT